MLTDLQTDQGRLDGLRCYGRQLALWAQEDHDCFSGRLALIEAEIARLEDRDSDAVRLYEDAIRLARRRGFILNEGAASELAATFHTACGSDAIAQSYLRNASRCYQQWERPEQVRDEEPATQRRYSAQLSEIGDWPLDRGLRPAAGAVVTPSNKEQSL
jgi:hypothetical protein